MWRPGSAGSGDGVDISVQLRHVCLEYPYKSLQAATQNFDKSQHLGEGSAGTVFKGEMQDGSYAAVKMIDLASLGDNAMVAGFEEEVMILSKFRHPNVVVLMGWARQDTRRFLIYEFCGGGDVFGRLQKCKDGRHPFLWYERLSVCRDAAMGLAHLHNATPHAFHRDVKSSNILLSPSGAKIADFGLSLVAKTRTQSEMDCEFPSGTPGYTCPNYIQSGKMTEGSEVYSFGMVLLEVLLNMMPAGMMGEEFVYPIQDCIAPALPGALERAVSSADTAAGWPAPVAREVAALALACTDAEEARRPSFNDICRLLRFLQEQFPPTCVMAPPANQGLPPPGIAMQTGVIGMRPPMAMPPPQQIPQLLPQGAWLPVGPPPVVLQHGTVMPVLAHGPGRPPMFHPGMTHSGLPMPMMPGPAVMCPHPVVLVQQVAPQAGTDVWGSFMGRPAPAPPPGSVAPVEVALEVAHVHGAALDKMRPEFRMLPLLPAVDIEGRRMAVLGRQHQPQWFESVLLDHTDLSCISREAFGLFWGGPDPGQAALTLRVIGSNIILVDDAVAPPGKLVALQPGSLITFAFQGAAVEHGLFVILSFRVHCSPQLASAPCRGGLPLHVGPPPGPPRLGQAPGPGAPPPGGGYAASVPQALDTAMPFLAPVEEAWKLECIYVTGLGPEAFWALPVRSRTMSLTLTGPGAPAHVLGRAHQKDMFEVLLAHEPNLLAVISRSHVQIEEVARKDASSAVISIDSVPTDETPGSLLVTNLSSNVIVASCVNSEPLVQALYQNANVQLRDGDTLSFATEQHTVCTSADEDSSTPRTRTSSAQAAAAASAMQARSENDVTDATEASIAVVPFLTFRVTAPPAPPPPSPFVMVSPPSVAISTAGSQAHVEGAQTFKFGTSSQEFGVPEEVPREALSEPARASLKGAVTVSEADNRLRRGPWASCGGGSVPSERAALTAPVAGAKKSPSRKAGSLTNDQCVSQ